MSASALAVLSTGAQEVFNLLGIGGATQWAIYSAGSSDPAIQPDSFKEIDFRSDARVCDYPMEAGSFESYNKVMVPKDFRIQLVCSGQNMSVGDFLQQLEVMRQSTNLYDIATPDILYQNCSLVRADYKRTSTNGVSMVTVDAGFQEIRQAGDPTYSSSGAINSASPSAASPENLGTVHPGDTVTVSFPPETPQ